MPKTLDAVRRRQRLNKRNSKNGYKFLLAFTLTLKDTPQYDRFLIYITAEMARDGHTDPTEKVIAPAPTEHPDLLVPFLKLNPTVAMRVQPIGNFAQKKQVCAI